MVETAVRIDDVGVRCEVMLGEANAHVSVLWYRDTGRGRCDGVVREKGKELGTYLSCSSSRCWRGQPKKIGDADGGG